MNASMQYSRYLFAVAMIALGVTGLINGDFALVWQNVPSHFPARAALAYVFAGIEVATGIGLLFKRTLTWTCRVLLPLMLLWLLLKIPAVIHAPSAANAWGGFGEIAAMTAGVWSLFAAHAGAWETRRLKFAVGNVGIRVARWLLIVALPCLGADVIVAAVTAGDKVMQPWLQHLPYAGAWAAFTGIASLATCLALLFNVVPRLAATLEAFMILLIGLIYWAPDLYTGRTATTAFIITVLVAAGVGLVAAIYPPRSITRQI